MVVNVVVDCSVVAAYVIVVCGDSGVAGNVIAVAFVDGVCAKVGCSVVILLLF